MAGKAVLGLGGTIDFELYWDAETLESLAVEFGITDLDPVAPRTIDSERSLVLSVLHHLDAGTGGEHFVESPEIIQRFAARFGYRTTLGGTPVRAALAMSALGIGSTVHLVSIDDDVRRLLPDDVAYLCSARHDTTDPHLILQYPAGARIRLAEREIVSAGANRLIYPCDRPNAELRLSEDLPAALRTASVFLVSGMNSIQMRDTLDLRLAQLLDAMTSLPSDAVTLYENGGFHVPEFSQAVLDALGPSLDIVSLNEDELMGALGRRVNLLDAGDVVEAVGEFAARVPVPVIVLHTRYFALAHGVEANRMRPVLASGTAVSGTRYAFGDRATRHAVERLDAEGRRSAVGLSVAEFVKGAEDFCVVPALDLPGVAEPTTIGLGDSFVGGMVAELVGLGAVSRTDTIRL